MGSIITGHGRPILVVEDEPLLLIMAVDLVEDAGFQAVEAHDADSAIRVLETRPDIRIVFSDINMPGSIDGMKLAARIRERWPPIDIILTSGHFAARDVTLPARSLFFAKPYDPIEVTAAMRRMAA